MSKREFWGDLLYIEMSPDSKIPARQWGGLDQDLESAEHVYTADELEPGRRYAYVAHRTHDLGIVDLDLYKDEAPDDGADVKTGHHPLIVESPSGGMHVPFLVPRGVLARTKSEARANGGPTTQLRVADEFTDWVDLKGELGGGYCVIPFGTDYEVTDGSADEPPVVLDPTDGAELSELLNYDGEAILETVDHPDISPGLENAPAPGKVTTALGDEYGECERHGHPFHDSSRNDNFYIFEGGEFWYCYRHEVGGTLLHILGMDQGRYECGDWDRMPAGERAEIHRAVRRQAKDEGREFEDEDAQRKWVADTSGLEEKLGALQ